MTSRLEKISRNDSLADFEDAFVESINMRRCQRHIGSFSRLTLIWLVFAVPAARPLAATAQVASVTSATQTKPELSEKIIAAGRKMVRDFPESSYSHKTRIDAAAGICEVDCSAFVATVVKSVSPGHIEGLPLKKSGRKRPLAEDFYAGFVQAAEGRLPGWEAVTGVSDARPGDVLAWYKEDHKQGENTGHVMLIEERPVDEGQGKWRVRIMDSTSTPHAQDTRPSGKSGMGSGTIWLDVDNTGQIRGYRWKSATGKLNENPIAIGRAVKK